MFATAVLILSGLVAASQASAQGFYIGGSVGQSDFDDSNTTGLITSGAVDGKDTGYKIFGGYQFNQYIGVELAYVDLGQASYSGFSGAAPVTGGTVKTSGLNISAVGTLPLSSGFALFGKAGLYVWEAKANDVTGGVPFSEKQDGTDLSLGIGASYDFTKNFAIRAEWERFKAVGDIDLLSIGVVYKF
jgi:OOP family OmpA-OmpF porin